MSKGDYEKELTDYEPDPRRGLMAMRKIKKDDVETVELSIYTADGWVSFDELANQWENSTVDEGGDGE